MYLSIFFVTCLVIILMENYLYYVNPFILFYYLMLFLFSMKFMFGLNYKITLLVACMFIIYLLFMQGTIETTYSGVKGLLNSRLYERIPLTSHLLNEINYILNVFVKDKSKKLIDFGCGDCKTLNKFKFKYKIGIDYDKNCYDDACKNGHGINELYNIDILDYEFKDNCVIYMYEPLWQNPECDVYEKLFFKLSKLDIDIEIIYVSGIKRLLSSNFFEKYGFKIKYEKKYGSVFRNRSIVYSKNDR